MSETFTATRMWVTPLDPAGLVGGPAVEIPITSFQMTTAPTDEEQEEIRAAFDRFFRTSYEFCGPITCPPILTFFLGPPRFSRARRKAWDRMCGKTYLHRHLGINQRRPTKKIKRRK